MNYDRQQLKRLLARHSGIKLAILFGSLARGTEGFGSDVDLAVAADRPLGSEEKARLMEVVALLTGRSVDLIDLQTANGLVLREALVTGDRLLCRDRGLYAALIEKMLLDQADWAPYRRRILAQRRHNWIGV